MTITHGAETTTTSYEARPLNDGSGLWALHRVDERERFEAPRVYVNRAGRLAVTLDGIGRWHTEMVRERRVGPAVTEAAAREKARSIADRALREIAEWLRWDAIDRREATA